MRILFETNIIPSDGIIEIIVQPENIDLKDEVFIIRPEATSGTVSIYNPKTDSWVSEAAVWSKMPFLTQDMRLKIASQRNTHTDIAFEIQNKYTAVIEKTNTKRVWNKTQIQQYVQRINANIALQTLMAEDTTTKTVTDIEQEGTEHIQTDTARFDHLYLYLGLFIGAVILGVIWHKIYYPKKVIEWVRAKI